MPRISTSLCALLALGLLGPAAADAAGTGGTAVAAGPKVTGARCADGAQWRCAGGRQLRLAGEQLTEARTIVFLGHSGKADDRRARPRARVAHALSVAVPRDAVSGPLRVHGRTGDSSPSRVLRIRSAGVSEGTPATTKLFAGDVRQATFRYRVEGSVPAGAAIEIVRIEDGQVVLRRAVAAGSGVGIARWNGFVGNSAAPTGQYAFRVSAGAEGVVSPEPGEGAEFTVYDHLFPIRGRHDLGQTATNNFGGARNHQGQDMFAACGTPLAAVTSGAVTYAGYQAAAGNYVVLKRSDGESYAYMHMRDPALVQTGARVYTGQPLGFVGETGRATGCHLHFELWTAPGWYSGGEAIDPLPALRRWDQWS